MQKVKLIFVLFFSCIVCFGITANAQERGLVNSRYQVISALKLYDTVNQELYEFDNQKTMDLFLQSQRGGISLRNYPINERRTRTLLSWEKVHTSRHLLNKSIAGGSHGDLCQYLRVLL